MEVFNLAEELEKERKKNKELHEVIDKAIYYIELDMYGTALDILKGSDNNGNN